MTAPAEQAIRAACDRLCALLLDKNRRYGNSALDPVRIFSKADAVEQLRVRLDDKLSRVQRGNVDGQALLDVLDDIPGYAILMRIAITSDTVPYGD